MLLQNTFYVAVFDVIGMNTMLVMWEEGIVTLLANLSLSSHGVTGMPSY
jgi:hypothetical protein